MPYSNEHANRLISPDEFSKFRRENDKFGPGIHAIWGITSDGKVKLQSIRFSLDKFTPEQARQWLKDHNYPVNLEPATGEKEKKVWTVIREGDYRLTDVDKKVVQQIKKGKIL